ncbi:MAG: Uma2 family endonuclease, partial [Saprospiraceae bacterium]|nr:Uma2 family endonuclease [Saprospiraceae bacterium]
ITVEEYHKMGEVGILKEKGLELINGEIIEMSPIGGRHVTTVNKLNKLLNIILGDAAIISIQNPIIASNFSEPEPDIAILKYRADFYDNQIPSAKDVFLIIEISDTSIVYDKKIKLPLYAQSGVPECWLVDLTKQEIHIYWQPHGNAYKFSELVKLGETIKAQYFDLQLDTNQIFG